MPSSNLDDILDNSNTNNTGNDDSEDDDLSLFDDIVAPSTSSRPQPPSRSANLSGSRTGERFRRTSNAPTMARTAAATSSNTMAGGMSRMGSLRNFWTPRGNAKEVDQSVNLMDLPYDPSAKNGGNNGGGVASLQRSMVDIFLSDDKSESNLGGSASWDYGDKKKNGKKKCRSSVLWIMGILVVVILCMTFPAKEKFRFGSNHHPPAEDTPAPGGSPSETASWENSLEQVPQSSRLDAIEHWILKQDITDATRLRDTNSPAQRALYWLAKDDRAALPIPGYDDMEFTETRTQQYELLQRYALAVFFYSIEEGDRASSSSTSNRSGNTRTLQAVVNEATELSNREKFDSEWLTEHHVCNWHGVVCDAQGGYVTSLELSHHLLQGTLPREVFVGSAMPYLKLVDLDRNQFMGTLPNVETTQHPPSELQTLKVADNRLTGYLDNLMELPKLRTVDLSQNRLKGDIPGTIENLSNLESLVLSSNQLTSTGGALGKLPHLKNLRLYSNQIEGTIPTSWGSLTNLEELMISGNYFSGTIPESFGSMENLRVLLLDGNELKGQVPASLGRLTSLMRIQMDGNELTGEVPDEVCQLKDHKLVQLQSDCADGEIKCECCTECY